MHSSVNSRGIHTKIEEDRLVKEARDRASKYFADGYNCAQSVVLACAELMGLEDGISIVRSCAGFTGGLGYSGCICGALLGGALVIGAKYGSNRTRRRNKKLLRLTEELHRRFKQQFSTTCCRVLRNGMDFKDKRLLDRCRMVTMDTVEMVMEVLKD